MAVETDRPRQERVDAGKGLCAGQDIRLLNKLIPRACPFFDRPFAQECAGAVAMASSMRSLL